MALRSFLKQSFCIPKPTLTEKNLPDQSGKVFIVTGGYAGVGYQLTKILYAHNATIYVAGRSIEKGNKAINDFKKVSPASKGRLEFLQLDLADLTTIKESAEAFMVKESRLDVLWCNAGVMWPPAGSKTKQGYEQQIGTNCLGHFLFTELLYPVLSETAKTAPAGSVRVCWAASLGIDVSSPNGGIDMDEDGTPIPKWKGDQQYNYAMSKAGMYFYGIEFDKHHPSSGILSVSFNPGNLETELQRHTATFPGSKKLSRIVLHPAIFGAYTELWCGLSEELGARDNGIYVAPWGRKFSVRADVEVAGRRVVDGGSGKGKLFWDWSEKVTVEFK